MLSRNSMVLLLDCCLLAAEEWTGSAVTVLCVDQNLWTPP
jgi:hypothetical protein